MQLADAVARLAQAAEAEVRLLKRIDARAAKQDDDEALGVYRDHRGDRRGPHRMGAIKVMTSIPGALQNFQTPVPSEFWTLTDDKEAMISCPCGAEPLVAAGGLVECACDRFFAYDGSTVHVARFQEEAAGS